MLTHKHDPTQPCNKVAHENTGTPHNYLLTSPSVLWQSETIGTSQPVQHPEDESNKATCP